MASAPEQRDLQLQLRARVMIARLNSSAGWSFSKRVHGLLRALEVPDPGRPSGAQRAALADPRQWPRGLRDGRPPTRSASPLYCPSPQTSSSTIFALRPCRPCWGIRCSAWARATLDRRLPDPRPHHPPPRASRGRRSTYTSLTETADGGTPRASSSTPAPTACCSWWAWARRLRLPRPQPRLRL